MCSQAVRSMAHPNSLLKAAVDTADRPAARSRLGTLALTPMLLSTGLKQLSSSHRSLHVQENTKRHYLACFMQRTRAVLQPARFSQLPKIRASCDLKQQIASSMAKQVTFVTGNEKKRQEVESSP
jgi:hypothetical protein